MQPHIKSGQLVTVRPLMENEDVNKGDIVLCRVRGDQYLHLVVDVRDNQVLIGNAHGHQNGWTHRAWVYGKLVSVAA